MTKRTKKKRSIRITTHNRFINPECYNHPIWKRRKLIIRCAHIKTERIPLQKIKTATMVSSNNDHEIYYASFPYLIPTLEEPVHYMETIPTYKGDN